MLQLIRARPLSQRIHFAKSALALFQKEGIVLGPRNQEVLERFQPRTIPQEGLEEVCSVFSAQGVEP